MTDPRRRFIITRSARAAKVDTYDQMHEIAGELGYPSILEALEAVATLTAERDAAQAYGDMVDGWNKRQFELIGELRQTIETLRETLKCSITHNEHLASWITTQNAGYNFESLGEDMPGLKSALALTETKP
jgi:hypothetical protein